MPSVRNKTLFCEQCGSPLLGLAGEEGCLNCLLRTGIEGDAGMEASCSPNESGGRSYEHYEILTRPDGSLWELGRGALGVTYMARDINLNVTVALKLIRSDYCRRPQARERFLREAQAAAQLRHPNIASVFHLGTIEHDRPPDESVLPVEGSGDCFYVMEFVEGESLEARLQRAGPLSPHETIEMALQVARALLAAEKGGLAHQVLKPSNILLVPEEEIPGGAWVKVIGFGLASIPGEENEKEAEAGPLAQTAGFADRKPNDAGTANLRDDIYSLGEILWRALTPQPFEASGEGRTALAAKLNGAHLPADFAALLQSMLAPRPKDRPRSLTGLVRTLESCRRALDERVRHSRRRRVAVGLGLAAAIVGLALLLHPPVSDPAPKSIAVLPFRNLSSDPADAFFAEGVQDDILSRLIKVRDLKVMSRTGAARYPAEAKRNLRAIGRELGVRHLLEGSLRRSGDRVLLHVSLVDTRNGQEVWSEGYDRRLADAINLQGDLASDIADALEANLSSQERKDVAAKTTRNPDAYLLYLRGRKLSRSPVFVVADHEAARDLYAQAVALDPGFALAHARLASTLALLFRFRGPSDDLRVRAHAEAREALRLDPDLGEAYLADALCNYRIERDYEKALPQLEKAQRLMPNGTEAASVIAYIYRRRGQWREARTGLQNVLQRDPLQRVFEEELQATSSLLRDWPAAAQHADRAIKISPDIPPLRGERAWIEFWRSGDLVPYRNFHDSIKGFGDAGGIMTWSRWDMALLDRDFEAAQAALDRFPFETLPSVLSAPVPKSYLEGCIWLARGDKARAAQSFETARPSMEAEAIAHPDNPLRHARLGLLYAYMGRKTEAILEGEAAVRLCPVSEDAIDGHQWLCHLALIHARTGDNDLAIALVERLLTEPGCVSPLDEASMTLWELRLRWQWDPLRKDPRFQKILAGPEPATIF